MLFLSDPEALSVLARIEGDAWAQAQRSNPTNPYGFCAYQRAWDAFVKAGGREIPEAQPADLLEGGDGAFYGAGGYTRYRVTREGEIVALAASLDQRSEKVARIREAGVRIAGAYQTDAVAAAGSSG